VIPEFDLPGHTMSWFVGMPELAAAPGVYAIARDWGIFPAVMNAASDSTYAFLDAFLGEMAALFPDRYWHIGGDEVQDPQSRTLQPQFNLRMQLLLQKYGKSMAGWDDILAPGLAGSTVIQSWRGPTGLAATASQGYGAILSYGYYLNYLYPAAYHYGIDPGDGAGVLGGEACMWAEFAGSGNVESRIWPRMAAIAERFWSAKEVTDTASMYRRLAPVSRWLEWTGLRHRGDYLPMLETIAGGRSVEALRVLGDASESTGIAVRSRAQHYTSLTPLDRFVDAARPESEPVYRLELAAQGRTAADLALLRSRFREWVANDARLEALAGPGQYLAELVPLSANLKAVGEIGLRALGYLESGQAAPADWLAQEGKALDAMQQPVAEVVLAAARPVSLLLAALAPR
jgi:hexosaminidase